jgi:hypothetical protein
MGARWIGLLALLVLGLATAPAAADAPLPTELVTRIKTLDKGGNPEARAGAHPDVFVTEVLSASGITPPKNRDLIIDFPAGMGGDPASVPACPRAVFDGVSSLMQGCPPESQVGTLDITRLVDGSEPPETYLDAEPIAIYNLEPAPDEVIAFGGSDPFGRKKLRLSGRLRPGDSRLEVRVEGIPQEGFFIYDQAIGTKFTFWGIPADHQEGTSIPRRPLLTLPTRCDGPLAIDLHLRPWTDPEWMSGPVDSGIPLGGCGNLPFSTKVDLELENPSVDAPSGTAVSLVLPQGSGDPDGLVSSQAKSARVELPAGMALSPGVADRLSTCSDAQLRQGQEGEPQCPPSSKVGTVQISAPQLREPLGGNIYLGQERPGDRFRLFITASGLGAEMKFVSSLRPDPASGRIAAVFGELPQVSFSEMTMRFDGGPRALLATPTGCGEVSAEATATPYSGGPAAKSSDSVAISGRCGAAAPFNPSFAAGVSDPRGGRPTAFSTTITRRDGEQLPARLQIQFPLGLGASLGSVDLCPEADAAAGTCPAASRVGAAVADLGPGAEAARIEGSVYLTGPYRRAPFGLAVAFKAKLGAFDLGTLVVRGGLDADPESGQISANIDALPQSFEGMPVRFQTLGLDIDRPGFMRNPTSCAKSSIEAAMTSSLGAKARPSAPFRVRDCIGLPFKPAFELGLTGRSELHAGGRPGMTLSGRVPSAGANLRGVEVVLPRIAKFDSSKLVAICARADAAAGRCPKASQVGTASARTPMLREPLKGSLYAVQPKGNRTPDVWIELKGSGLEVRLRGETSTAKGRVMTRLVDLPDFTMSSFQMRFGGGAHGVFKLKSSPCRAGRKGLLAPIEIEGQNLALRQIDAQAKVTGGCGKTT